MTASKHIVKLIPFCLLFAVAAALFSTAPVGAQQQYPVKPLRLIVPFPPGGNTSLIGRMLSQKLAEPLGQQIVVDNRGGAGSPIGAALAAKAPPDGYTLFLASQANAISASLYSNLSFDLVRDFAPVTMLAISKHVLVVHPSLPVRSLKELIAFARARPGSLMFSSSGSGSSSHLAPELFASMAGIKMLHVPYKGGGPAIIAALTGEVSLMFSSLAPAIPHIKEGKLRALGIGSTQRSPLLPDVPTVSEAGLPGYDVSTWYGLVAPAGVPKEIIARLLAETVRVLERPDVKQWLHASAYEPRTSTPEEYAAFTRREVEKWAKVIKAAGVRVD